VTDKNKSSKVERQKIQVADKKASKGIKKKNQYSKQKVPYVLA
jgi:hypothetical protein